MKVYEILEKTTVDKKANRVTTQNDAGTVVKDRSGVVRSITSPNVKGVQAKQTFRPDSTPGYQQATYKDKSGINLDIKGSPETGYTRTAKTSVGGFGVQHKQRYDGSQQTKVDATLGKGKKIKKTIETATTGGTSAGGIAAVPGNGFANGGPGTLTRAGTTNNKKEKKKKKKN